MFAARPPEHPRVRERSHVPVCAPEALCCWDWRRKVSRRACLVVVSRGKRGEWCDLMRRWASFCVAGAGNRARQLKPLDFVGLCEKSRARVRARGCVRRGEIVAGAGDPWNAVAR